VGCATVVVVGGWSGSHADLIQRCEGDTLNLLDRRAAARLGRWRDHAAVSEAALIEYIKRLLRGDHRGNGWALDRKGGLSLERIVLDHRSDLFVKEDLREARRTLGIGARQFPLLSRNRRSTSPGEFSTEIGIKRRTS
jgi:hypothetical protein